MIRSTHGILASSRTTLTLIESDDVSDVVVGSAVTNHGFLDQSGNPTDFWYYTGSNDGQSLVFPDIHVGYIGEVSSPTASSPVGDVIINLRGDYADLGDAYLVTNSSTNGATATLNTGNHTVEVNLPNTNSTIQFEIRGKVTNKGGNVGTTYGDNMRGSIDYTALDMEFIATDGTNTETANSTGALTIYVTHLETSFMQTADANNLNGLWYHWNGTQVAPRYSSMWVWDGIQQRVTHPNYMPNSLTAGNGYRTPIQATDYYVANYPRWGAFRGTIQTFASPNLPYCLTWIATFYDILNIQFDTGIAIDVSDNSTQDFNLLYYNNNVVLNPDYIHSDPNTIHQMYNPTGQ